MKELSGKTALITGASRGIGPHIVSALAREGMHFVLSARSVEALEPSVAAARAAGARVTCITGDLRSRADIERLAARAESESSGGGGGIAVLVNNAGLEAAAAFDHIDAQTIDDMIAVNLTAPMQLTRLVLPHMLRRGEGHIVNIASLAGMVGTPYEATYTGTKAGMIGFSRSLYLEMRTEGHPIGVSVICPGFVGGAGMYQNAANLSGAKAPFMVGIVPVEKVARGVVHAIKNDEPEVILSGMPVKPFVVLQSLAPRLTARMSGVLGVPQLFQKWARAARAQ